MKYTLGYKLECVENCKNGKTKKTINKKWTIEEKFDIVSKVLAGNSIKSTAIEMGINSGLLYL